MIAFGLSQQRYTFRNMTHSAALNTTNLVRDIAVITETFLFFFLGTEVRNIFVKKIFLTKCNL